MTPAMETRLQKLANDVVLGKNHDGSWKLANGPPATLLFSAIKPYVHKAAYRSSRAYSNTSCAHEDLASSICLGIWEGLRTHGANYAGKGFPNFLKMKVNNVLTNAFNHRCRKKRKAEFDATITLSLDAIMSTADDSFCSVQLPAETPNGFIDTESLTASQRKLFQEISSEKGTNNMIPAKPTPVQMIDQFHRLSNDEKKTVCTETLAIVTGVPAKTLKKTLSAVLSVLVEGTMPMLITETKNEEENDVESKYNESKQELTKAKIRVSFNEVEHDKERAPMQRETNSSDPIAANQAEIGKFYVTLHDKKIQVIDIKPKEVRLKVMVTGDEVCVPITYMIRPEAPAVDDAQEEVDPIEQAIAPKVVASADEEDENLESDLEEDDEVLDDEDALEEDEEVLEKKVVESAETEIDAEELDDLDDAGDVVEVTKAAEEEEEEEEDVEEEDEDEEEDVEEEEDEAPAPKTKKVVVQDEEEDEEDVEEDEEESEEEDEDEEEDEEEHTVKPKQTRTKKVAKPVSRKAAKTVTKKRKARKLPVATVDRKKVAARIKSQDDKSKKRGTRRGTAKDFVISLLRKGPKTIDDLATKVISEGLTKNKEIKKVKNYIGVMLHTLKRDGILKNHTERGTYIINK